jgi:hypothetical protein
MGTRHVGVDHLNPWYLQLFEIACTKTNLVAGVLREESRIRSKYARERKTLGAKAVG